MTPRVEDTTHPHPLTLAWEEFRREHATDFSGDPRGLYLANRLQRAFEEGWHAARRAARDAWRDG